MEVRHALEVQKRKGGKDKYPVIPLSLNTTRVVPVNLSAPGLRTQFRCWGEPQVLLFFPKVSV
jgi:hypothetical protein